MRISMAGIVREHLPHCSRKWNTFEWRWMPFGWRASEPTSHCDIWCLVPIQSIDRTLDPNKSCCRCQMLGWEIEIKTMSTWPWLSRKQRPIFTYGSHAQIKAAIMMSPGRSQYRWPTLLHRELFPSFAFLARWSTFRIRFVQTFQIAGRFCVMPPRLSFCAGM